MELHDIPYLISMLMLGWKVFLTPITALMFLSLQELIHTSSRQLLSVQ